MKMISLTIEENKKFKHFLFCINNKEHDNRFLLFEEGASGYKIAYLHDTSEKELNFDLVIEMFDRYSFYKLEKIECSEDTYYKMMDELHLHNITPTALIAG